MAEPVRVGQANDRRSVEAAIAATYRAEWGRLLSLLVARTRRLDLAEDALGEAFARASTQWPADGMPNNPAGWLYTTASRLILGGLRAEAMRGRKTRLLAVDPTWVRPAGAGTPVGSAPGPTSGTVEALEDERLALILLCCHPALHPEARSPLALRLVIGTRTEEIARLFLVPTTTMAARITRAKKKIVTAGIPLSVPVDDALRVRLDEVCRTIYLAFTAGYSPGRGPDLLRADLAGEAVELAALLHRLVPEADQVRALLGLLLAQHARRESRAADGTLVTLAEQDRSRWHHDEIRVAAEILAGLSRSEGQAEELRLQGLIAIHHGRAATAADTDWTAIKNLYRELEQLTGSPVVRLNRAVAIGEADGPEAGLAALDGLDEHLADNHRLHAVSAELARKAGNRTAARAAFQRAVDLCRNDVERDHLARMLDRLEGG